MNFLNVNKQHDLITRRQTYVLDRKLVTIHSNDRDIKKWPRANNFEIELPETLHNVQSLRLVMTSFPMKLYTFSHEYQNTKLSFQLIPQPRQSTDTPIYVALNQNRNHIYTIEIQEGNFVADQICREIERKMNREVYDFLISVGLTPEEAEYNYFTLTYDSVSQKILFGNRFDNFSLNFHKPENYRTYDVDEGCGQKIDNCARQPNVWQHYTQWGLPYYLGFQKQKYVGCEISTPFTFDYREDPLWLFSSEDNPSAKAYYVEAPSVQCLVGESVMYMILDKFNTMDEIVPYSESTNNMYNNDYNGTVNAAFEKIPLNIMGAREVFDSQNTNLENISYYDVPIESIRKVKIQFRFHDGRLVDFQNCDFNFTLGFNCLRDEIPREYEVRVPVKN